MKRILYLLARLFAGFILYGLAIVVMLNAKIGLSPWDVFHQGISLKTGITMGQASITVGLVIVILDAILGRRSRMGDCPKYDFYRSIFRYYKSYEYSASCR